MTTSVVRIVVYNLLFEDFFRSFKKKIYELEII